MKNLNKAKGTLGENMAAQYVLSKEYQVLCRNFIAPYGEIDIIAVDKDYIVFIEVKTRQSEQFGTPAQAVNFHKQRKISSVAAFYITSNQLFDKNIRFDIIEVDSSTSAINHIENAFDSTVRI